MDQQRFRCAGCKKLHRERVAGQQYCGAVKCQRKRKNKWRRERYARDATYRETAQASTAAWLECQGGAAAYYRDYRKRKKRIKDSDIAGAADGGTPAEVAKCASRMDKSAVSPPKETGQPSAKADANRDAKSEQGSVMTGKYLLVPADGAKGDAIIVQLSVIADKSGALQRTTEFPRGLSGATVGP